MLPFLEHINQLLWGFPVLILLSSAHLYFTAKLKFPQRLTLKAIRLSVTPEKMQKAPISQALPPLPPLWPPLSVPGIS